MLTSPSSQGDKSHFNTLVRDGFKRYWFIALPAIMLNIGLTLDHVLATNNGKAYIARTQVLVSEAENSLQRQDDEPISDLVNTHWTTTNEQGNLDGRISSIEPQSSITVPIGKLNISLLQNGIAIREASTNYDGKFTLNKVDPGTYTLLAAGQSGFLAYGVNILPKIKAKDLTELNNLDLNPSGDVKAYYASHFKVPTNAIVSKGLQIDAAAVPPEFQTLQRISQNYLPENKTIEVDKDSNDATSVGEASEIASGFDHPLTADGSFTGSVQPIATADGTPGKLSEMNVFLIQDDIEIARATVEPNGKFAVEDIDPGVYGLIIAGNDGFAAMSVRLTSRKADAATNDTDRNSKTHFVSHRVESETPRRNGLSVSFITNPNDIAVVKQQVSNVVNMRQQMFAAQVGADNSNSNSSSSSNSAQMEMTQAPGDSNFANSSNNAQSTNNSGGGGGSGGSSIGSLLGIAGLAVGTTAIATQEDDTPTPPQSPVSPLD
ncbi:MAG: hypothetical protein ACKVHR_06775 [Pirellulales bacterium]